MAAKKRGKVGLKARLPRRGRHRRNDLDAKTLGELLCRNPGVIRVLDKYGINFCASCYLTLFSPIEDVPGFHAVTDKKKFLADLCRAASE